MSESLNRSPIPFIREGDNRPWLTMVGNRGTAGLGYRPSNTQPMTVPETNLNNGTFTYNDLANDVAGEVSSIESMAGPTGVAMSFLTDLGRSLNSIQTTNTMNSINTQYNSNLAHGSGIGVTQNAETIRTAAINNENIKSGSGALGSLLTPIGTELGRAIGGLFATPMDHSLLDVAYSPKGMINPQSDNINLTQSSASVNDNEMENGIQMSESSSQMNENN